MHVSHGCFYIVSIPTFQLARSAQEIQSRNRESHIFSYNEATADERRASNARIQELSQASSSQAPSLADAAGRPLRQYGESCGPNSPFGKYHNSVGLATQFAIAQSSLSSTEAMMDNGPGTHQHVPSAVVPLDKAMKQAFLQGEAVVTTLHSQASHAGAPPHASETIRTAVSLVSASPPSAVPGSYPVTAAALRELHGSPAPPVEGGPRSPPRYSPAAGPAHEFVPASTSRAARQALYTSDNTAQGMMAGSASSAQMTLMESSWGGEGAIRSARYAPAGVPAGGRWDRPGEVTHPAHAHAARQRLLQGSIPPGHLG